MAKITTEQIKELRDMTGISVMQVKKALEEAEPGQADCRHPRASRKKHRLYRRSRREKCPRYGPP